MKICRDERIWGQNNKEAGNHLGILRSKEERRQYFREYHRIYDKTHKRYIRKGYNHNSSHSGENHPNWKGGITPERTRVYFTEEYINWRTTIFKRDNYICQICNKGGYIEAHHILPFISYPEKRYDLNNGMTLCRKCHDETKEG